MFVLALSFYHIFLAANFSAAHDSINYLNSITRGENLFHQHHLLYNYTAHQYYKLLKLFFSSTPEYYLVESFTALWGAASLAVSYLLLRNRFEVSWHFSFASVCTIGFSFGFWFYSTNVEVYTAPVFFLMLALYVLTGRRLGNKSIVLIAVFHSLAILFHQVNILFLPVVVTTLIFRRAELPLARLLLMYFGLLAVVVGSVYLFIGVYIEQHSFFNEWFTWIKGYTEGHSFWRPLSAQTPINVAVGYSHSLIGGHFLFQVPFVENFLTASITNHGLQDEIFLGSRIEPALAYALSGLCIGLAILFCVLVFRAFRMYRLVSGEERRRLSPLLFSLLVYSLFFFFWMPEILEFWIFQSMVIWLILAAILGPRRDRKDLLMLAASALLLFAINYFGSVRWLGKLKYDWYYQKTMSVKEHVKPGDLLVVQDPWIFEDYMRYFLKANLVRGNDQPAALIETVQRQQAAGGKIYFLRTHNNAAYEQSPAIDSILSSNSSARRVRLDPELWLIE